RIELRANVAEIRIPDRMQIGHLTGIVKTDKRLVRIALFVNRNQLLGAFQTFRAKINGLENAAFERQQLSSESKFTLLEPRRQKHFGDMPVIENGIRGKIIADFTKARFQTR